MSCSDTGCDTVVLKGCSCVHYHLPVTLLSVKREGLPLFIA